MEAIASFSRPKLKRILERRGSIYTFCRPKLNEFKEPTEGIERVSILGLYHTEKNYLPQTVNNSGKTHMKISPMIICLYHRELDLRVDDYVYINDVKHKIVAINNVNSANVAYIITLEEEQNGRI